MKIQPVQNQNTNFKGIFCNKQIGRLLTPEILEQTGIQECGSKFDVFITQEARRVRCGWGYETIQDIFVQVGEKVDDWFSSQPELRGVRGDKFTLKELLKDGGLLKTNFDRKMAKECSGRQLCEYVMSGKINPIYIDIQKMRMTFPWQDSVRIINELQEQQLIKDKNGNLPLHKARTADDFYKINEMFHNNPLGLAQIYLTPNNNGDLPINDYHIFNNFKLQKDIFHALRNAPKERVSVFTAKTSDGDSLLDNLIKNQRDVSHKEEIEDMITQILHASVNKIPESEISIETSIKILENLDERKDNGNILNFENILTDIVNFLITDVKPDEKQKIISKLKNIPGIDYNKTDKNGISIAEYIINAEDMDLIGLLEGKQRLFYFPELDFAYQRIENPEFKKKVDNLKFDFPDLEEAIKIGSYKSIKAIEYQLKSPLFKKEYIGKNMIVGAMKNDNPDFIKLFLKNYGESICDDFNYDEWFAYRSGAKKRNQAYTDFWQFVMK